MSNAENVDRLELLRQQFVLARFGELALRSNDLDEILTEACRLVGEGLGTDLAKVMELQEDGATLLVRAGVGWEPGVVGQVTLKLMDGTSEDYALKTGEPLISPDIRTEARFSYPPFLVENGVRAVASVVIIGGEGRPPFGILQIDSRKPRRFTAENITFLRSYANLLAAAVDRLRVIGEVRDESEQLRFALEAGELGSWKLDLASGVMTSTLRHMQIFGYADPSAAWTYDIFLSHVLPDDCGHVSATFRTAVDTGTEWHFECRIRRAGDNEVRWIEAKGRAAGNRSSALPTHLLGIVADITVRKTAERAMRRSHDTLEGKVAERTRELTEANVKLRIAAEEHERVEEALHQSQKMEAIGQLTGGLAHDFNNLLAGISGSLELLRTRAAQGRAAEFGRYIETALASTSRAAALTHRLLAFARRQTLDPKPTSLNELVGGMEELFSRTVGPSIQIDTRLAGEPWTALCDPNQLENALLNLVINACDAMPDGGQLVIETTNTVVPDRRGVPGNGHPINVPPGDYTVLSVTDTGTGMAPDVLARAFDPFFTTKPLGQGTGLGLSMIHGFVEQSGGHVHLRSQEGQGTCATIYLLRHFGAAGGGAEVEAAAGLPEATSAVVLVVEDEPPVRMVVVDVLSDLGYTVLEAGDSRAGLSILESTARIDLLLTDVGLPGSMNGRQLADASRQRRPDLKVLFMTGYADTVVVGSGAMEGGMQIMIKPFALDALAARVQGIMGG